MARVIILSIPDNDEAEDFARWILERASRDDQPVVPPDTTIEAMIARPTAACKGGHRMPGRLQSEHSYTRTAKFGWFVCSVCKKPAPLIVRNFIRNMLGGYNDLLPTLTGGEPVKPSWVKETLIAVQNQFNRR